MARKVFISYRRNDARYQARMIYDAFQDILGPDGVSMDVDSVPPGVNFRKLLKEWVDQCEVLLAVIGPGWIDATEPKTGQRRLDSSNDFVRIEITEALARNIRVVPLLLDGAPMPEASSLPEDLKELPDRQAWLVEFRTFDQDVARLIRRLGLGNSDTGEPVAVPKDPSAASRRKSRSEVVAQLARGPESDSPVLHRSPDLQVTHVQPAKRGQDRGSDREPVARPRRERGGARPEARAVFGLQPGRRRPSEASLRLLRCG